MSLTTSAAMQIMHQSVSPGVAGCALSPAASLSVFCTSLHCYGIYQACTVCSHFQTMASYLKLLKLLQCKVGVHPEHVCEQQSNKGCINMLGPTGHCVLACNEQHQQLQHIKPYLWLSMCNIGGGMSSGNGCEGALPSYECADPSQAFSGARAGDADC
jgi:hypothetical protein